MNEARGPIRPRGEGGYALVFALAVMLVILAVGMRFLAVVHSRHKVSDNEKTALQATLIADAGLERVVRELSQDMSWNGSFSDVPFAGGTYSASVTSRESGYVVVAAQGTFGTVTRQRVAHVYTPTDSGSLHIWASHYGTGTNEWQDEQNLIDSAEGESGWYAHHRLGEGADQMSLAGLGSDVRAVPITKVEIVISGYVSDDPDDDYLRVQWHFSVSAATGQWHIWPNDELDDHEGIENTGRMYLDVTDDPPPGGWHWEQFYHGTDLELRLASVKVGDDDKVELYVDCAGFRVTWDTGL